MKTLAAIEKNEREQNRAEGGSDARLIEVFSRRETPAQRARRIARKRVNPELADSVRRWLAA